MKVEIIKQNVGVDVAKDDMKVAFSHLTADHRVVLCSTRTFANNAKGFEQLQEWTVTERSRSIKLKNNQPTDVSFTMEATGVYYEGLAYFLRENGYCVHVVLPNLAKKYIQSLGLKSKTDKMDTSTCSATAHRDWLKWVWNGN